MDDFYVSFMESNHCPVKHEFLKITTRKDWCCMEEILFYGNQILCAETILGMQREQEERYRKATATKRKIWLICKRFITWFCVIVPCSCGRG